MKKQKSNKKRNTKIQKMKNLNQQTFQTNPIPNRHCQVPYHYPVPRIPEFGLIADTTGVFHYIMTMKILIVGVGGPSSSGKTTICNGLQTVLPHSTVVHLDDFYLPDSEIPIDPENGLDNWDCPELINWPKFCNYIEEIRNTNGEILPYKSKELESILKLTSDEIAQARDLMDSSLQCLRNIHVVLIDGFMLYHNDEISQLFDVKLYFRAPYKMLKARREARTGYTTEEGFWVDPPGYFDKIVWPQYVLTHKYLFENDNVEGVLKRESIESGIRDIYNDNTRSINALVLMVLETISKSCS